MILLATFLLLFQDPASETGDYTNRISRKLSPGANIRVVADSDLRAGTLPGGESYVSTGLFARVQNEAEWAGVIAHQLAHSAAGTDCIRYVHIGRHDTEQQNDREHEAAADKIAIRMLAKAGYQPMAMLDFFSRYRREGKDLPKACSARDLLMEKLEMEDTGHPLTDAVLNTPEFERVHPVVR